MALLHRLENDRSLARFSGQFVPVKIITDGNPEWGKWARMYPLDKRGIPQLYVIRADGEKIYADVGSLSGDSLPRMMLASLQQAGRGFNEVELALLENSVTSTKRYLGDGDLLSAALSLSALSKLGNPEDLGSFAKPAIEASELYANVQTAIESSISQANDRLTGSENAFESILALAEAQAAYSAFPSMKAKAVEVTRDVKKMKSHAEALAQAQALVKARSYRAAVGPSGKRRAVTAYSSVIRKYPGSYVDELARAELATIDPDAKVFRVSELADGEKMPSQEDGFREWTAGGFKTRAKVLQQKDGKVQLQKVDGTKIVVEAKILSDEDRAYLENQ